MTVGNRDMPIEFDNTEVSQATNEVSNKNKESRGLQQIHPGYMSVIS